MRAADKRRDELRWARRLATGSTVQSGERRQSFPVSRFLPSNFSYSQSLKLAPKAGAQALNGWHVLGPCHTQLQQT